MPEKSMILTPEKRFLTMETAEMRVKKADNGSKRLIGYAAKFGKLSQDLGGFVEQIHPKAFDRCLKRCDVRGLKNHNPEMLLGRTKSGTMELTVDDVGLRYDIALPETVVGRDLVTEIERGDIDGSSFSFTTEPDGDEWDDSTSPPTRTLTNVRDLFDVGPVAYPAYLDTEASIASMRSLERHNESLAREQRAREEGTREALKVKRIRILKVRLGHSIF
jgi:HK97 family phage prohead protease